jgi:tyrosyl-tRNA synthetase
MQREAHPMQAKKELARKIVADFHSAEAAAKAGEDWAKQFQRSEVPQDIEQIRVRYADVRSGDPGAGPGGDPLAVRLDRLLVLCGLAESTTDAARKLKAGAVKLVNQETGAELIERGPRLPGMPAAPMRLVLRVGKKIRAALIES